jgi:predicted lipoprotein with Yx(FWY)xxD motif
MPTRHLAATIAAAVLLIASCGGDDAASTDSTATGANATDSNATEGTVTDGTATGGTATGSTAAGDTTAGAATVNAAETSLGLVLTDGEGLTLYYFTEDSEGSSACDGECAAAWPPLLTSGDPVAGDGADASKLGTLERSDGTVQVSYDGRPLYRFANDAAPGDTTGEGVNGVWFVAPADGATRDY